MWESGITKNSHELKLGELYFHVACRICSRDFEPSRKLYGFMS